MATASQGFISAAPPTLVVYACNTTLFNLAQLYLGNALLWPIIAEENNLLDPWIYGNVTINIPINTNSALALNPTGIFTPH